MGERYNSEFSKIPILIFLLSFFYIITPGVTASGLDNHYFFIKKTGTNFCLSVTENVVLNQIVVSENTVCETLFDDQKFLYNAAEEKIYVYNHQDQCLQVNQLNNFEVDYCNQTSAFSSPDLSGSVLDISSIYLTFTSADNGKSHPDDFTILRSEGLEFTDVPQSSCILHKIATTELNADYYPKDVAGFDVGDKIWWKCADGYTTTNFYNETYSTCTEDGWDEGLEPLICVRIQCQAPLIGDNSLIFVSKDNGLEQLQLTKF